MAQHQTGKLIIGFESRVSGEEVGTMLKQLGLVYTNDFCVMGDFYSVKVPVGTEKQWARVFKNLSGIRAIMHVPTYERHTQEKIPEEILK